MTTPLIQAARAALESMTEVIRISDRKHDAWDAAKVAISDLSSAIAEADVAPRHGYNDHPDDEAAERFCARMKHKLGLARQRGKSGWQDPSWTVDAISKALREHVEKGDPVDVANYCMFLSERKEAIAEAEKQPRPVTPYTCPKCHALWLFWPKEQSGFEQDTLNLRSQKSCGYCEPAGVEQLVRLERVPAVLNAPEAEKAEPVAWRVRMICCGADSGFQLAKTWDEADRFRNEYTSGYGVELHGYSAPKHASGHKRAAIVEALYAAPQAPAGMQLVPVEPTPEIDLAIIRKWPDGFEARLQHVWLDVVSFVPNVKLYDLQRTLAEYGFTMRVYDAPKEPT